MKIDRFWLAMTAAWCLVIGFMIGFGTSMRIDASDRNGWIEGRAAQDRRDAEYSREH